MQTWDTKRKPALAGPLVRGRLGPEQFGELASLLFTSSPEVLLLLDAEGEVLDCNLAAARFLGFERDQAIGRNASSWVPAEEWPVWRQLLRNGPEAGTQATWALRSDGTRIPVLLSTSPLGPPGGDDRVKVAVLHDLKARPDHRPGPPGNDAPSQERDRRAAFVNAAAHELKTPLVPLKVQTYLLKTALSEGLNPDQAACVEVLDRNLDRLGDLVEDILAAARVQAGRLKMRRVPIDVNVVIQEAFETFESAARQMGHTLAWRRSPPIPVEADAQRLAQVLTNLLSNALKFTPPGGRIDLRARTDDDHAVIEVEDTGHGLEREQIDRLFQPFSQVHVKEDEKDTGTGLGLYISRGIVEDHNGTLIAASPGPGRGAVFRIRLPLTDRPLPPQPTPGKAKDPARRQRSGETDTARRLRELI